MNAIWTVVTVVALCVSLFSDPSGALNVALSSCADALGLTINLCSVYAWWLGVFSVLECSGVVDGFSKFLVRPIKVLFGKINQKASKALCLSISANMLGVSNAATPYGIEACSQMQAKGEKLARPAAMLFMLNSTSLQFLPTTVIGLRANSGSLSPSDIVLPTLIISVLTTVVGVLLISFLYKRKQ